MNRSAGGLVLLLVGSLGLIGFLTGNIDRWIRYLFSPGGGTTLMPIAPTSGSPSSSSTQQRGAA